MTMAQKKTRNGAAIRARITVPFTCGGKSLVLRRVLAAMESYAAEAWSQGLKLKGAISKIKSDQRLREGASTENPELAVGFA